MSVTRLAQPIRALVEEARERRDIQRNPAPAQTDAQRAAALHLVLQAGRTLGALSTYPTITTLKTATAAIEHAMSCARQCEAHCADAAAYAVIRDAVVRLCEQLGLDLPEPTP